MNVHKSSMLHRIISLPHAYVVTAMKKIKRGAGMKKVITMLLMAVAVNAFADEWYDESTGFTWVYTVKNGNVTINDVSPRTGVNLVFPDEIDGCPVVSINTASSLYESASTKSKLISFSGALILPKKLRTIGACAFNGCSAISGALIIPDSVTHIGSYAFYGCSRLTGSLTIPGGVTRLSRSAFEGCSGFTGSLILQDGVLHIDNCAFKGCGFVGSLMVPESVINIWGAAFEGCNGITDIVFEGLPPKVMSSDAFPLPIRFLEKSSQEWKKVLAFANLREPMRDGVPVAKVISAKMRESDPTIMDVVYKVTSAKPTVKVRALAFQDGERSFAKVVRPETFVEDKNGNPTAGNVGDAVTANEEHTLSWKVSADWNATLAKVKFEVLAVEDEILPLELVTLPKTETQPKMVFSWNYVIPSRAFDALLWLYADKDLGLTLTNGVLKNGNKSLASGASVSGNGYDALVYIYGKMGYELLQGARLDYVRERSRLDLPGISERQYAVKVIEE